MERPHTQRPIRLSSAAKAILALVLLLCAPPGEGQASTRLEDTRRQLDSLARAQETQRGRLADLSGREAGGLDRLVRLEEQGAARRRLCRQLEQEIVLLQEGEAQQGQELERSLLRLDSLARGSDHAKTQDVALRRESAQLARKLFPLRRVDGLALWFSSAWQAREGRNLRLLPYLLDGLRSRLLELAGVQRLLRGMQDGTRQEGELHRQLLQQKTRDKTRAGDARQEAARELDQLKVEEAEQGRLLTQVRRDKALAAEQAERMRRAGDEVARQVADLQRRWTERESRLGEEKRRQDAVAGRLAKEESAPSAVRPAPAPLPAPATPRTQDNAPTGGLSDLRGRLPAPVGGKVIRPYGSRQDTALGTVLDNPGVDYRCAPGSPVKAVHTGRVEKITWVAGFGNTILLSHGQDCWTVYAKLEDVDVREGQSVAGGQLLGRAGRFDSADQGALHFELWQDRQARNPGQWLKP